MILESGEIVQKSEGLKLGLTECYGEVPPTQLACICGEPEIDAELHSLLTFPNNREAVK